MPEKSKPFLFFRDIEEPGNVSIFATLKEAIDLVAKNKKPYLRLVLTDPSSRNIYVQIWSDNEIYAPVNMFLRKYLLQLGGPIHLMDLSFDGEYFSSSIKTKIDPIPTQHAIYEKFIQLNNYRILKTIPEDPKLLNEIHKLVNTKPLIEAILARMADEGVVVTEELFWEVTKLICDKTYTGTIHLIMDQPQLAISSQYENYVLKQLEILLIAFEEDIAGERIVPIILLRRLQKDLISLFEYTKLHE
ncbi:MAG: hypothetical protein ACTSXA_11580 [Candidatus Heimdallarchaeota archaeon]